MAFKRSAVRTPLSSTNSLKGRPGDRAAFLLPGLSEAGQAAGRADQAAWPACSTRRHEGESRASAVAAGIAQRQRSSTTTLLAGGSCPSRARAQGDARQPCLGQGREKQVRRHRRRRGSSTAAAHRHQPCGKGQQGDEHQHGHVREGHPLVEATDQRHHPVVSRPEQADDHEAKRRTRASGGMSPRSARAHSRFPAVGGKARES